MKQYPQNLRNGAGLLATLGLIAASFTDPSAALAGQRADRSLEQVASGRLLQAGQTFSRIEPALSLENSRRVVTHDYTGPHFSAGMDLPLRQTRREIADAILDRFGLDGLSPIISFVQAPEFKLGSSPHALHLAIDIERRSILVALKKPL